MLSAIQQTIVAKNLTVGTDSVDQCNSDVTRVGGALVGSSHSKMDSCESNCVVFHVHVVSIFRYRFRKENGNPIPYIRINFVAMK